MRFNQCNLHGLYSQLVQENNNGSRTYLTPQGRRYPSVSSVTGLMNKEAIASWRRRVGTVEANRVSQAATTRGNQLHKTCELYLQNQLTEQHYEEMGDQTYRLFRQLQPFLDRNVKDVYGTEIPLYSDTLQLAGTCDALVVWDGVLTIVDYKTSGKPKKREWIQNYFLQCTAYCLMVNERTGIRVPEFAVCIAIEGQKEPSIYREKTKDFLHDLHALLVNYGTFPLQSPANV